MAMRPVVYSCVTAGYDAVAPVAPDWRCEFVLFHDGTINVPEGWRGQYLAVEGVTGVNLNRYAKMLPHRLGLASGSSMYLDGNLALQQDPSTRIRLALESANFCAYPHPARDCPYAEIRETLRLGFVGPGAAWKQMRLFKGLGLPRKAGLFEAGALIRQHDDVSVIALGEAWWQLWQGGLRRDQPLLTAAAWQRRLVIALIGPNDMHDKDGDLVRIVPHSKRRTRMTRLPNRIAAEVAMYRMWLPK